MGDIDVDLGRWPQLPGALGVAGRCFPLHLLAAGAPGLLEWHAATGLPEQVSWDTLADAGRHEAICRRVKGTTGVDAPWWLVLHLRGVLFQIGTLQYTPYHMGLGPEQAVLTNWAGGGHFRWRTGWCDIPDAPP
jgi:N-acyltransferase N-terminal domain